MRQILRKLVAYWYPDYLKTEQSLEINLKFIIGLSYIGIFVELCYAVLNLSQGIPLIPTNLPLVGFVLLLMVVRYAKTYAMAAHAFLALFAATIAGLCTFYQSFPYTILLWTPVFVNVAVYLTGKRAGLAWSVVMALFVLCLFLVIQPGNDFGYRIQPEQIRPIAIVSVLLTIASALYSSILFRNTIARLTRDLAENNRRLREQKVAVEEVIRQKQMLISLVCHDIANPLHAISLAMSACRGRFPEDLAEIAAMVTSSASTISEIISDVSRMQALELGKLRVDMQAVNLLKVIRKIELMFSERLQSKNLQLIVDHEGMDELWVKAEENSLTNSVLSNVVSNAIKFSEPNRAIILQLRRQGGLVHVLVQDFGIGIPKSLLGDLFKHHKPTSRLGTQGERGTGFGLPLTKVYMDQYGGEIAINSVEKSTGQHRHGTTIVLTFQEAG